MARVRTSLDGDVTDPKRGDARKHTATGVVLYVLECTTYEGVKYVTFSQNPPGDGCVGIMQTATLEDWEKKTEAV